MSDCVRKLEHYLDQGNYSLVRIEERGRGLSWARLEHVTGNAIAGHKTVWLELHDEEDRSLAVTRYLEELDLRL
jgi:hypothetical protein